MATEGVKKAEEKKTTMVLGASPKSHRYSYKAMAALQQHGHPVIAVASKESGAHGIPIQTDWPESGSVNTLSLYLNPSIQKPLYDKIIALKPKRIIFNPGSENAELEAMAREAGMKCVQACTLVMLATGQF
jgi:uncharacterized protein